MKTKIQLIILFTLTAGIFGQQLNQKMNSEKPSMILVFTAVENSSKQHKVTELAAETIVELGKKENFMVEISDDPSVFNEQNIKHFSAIILLNTRGNIWNKNQKLVFKKYIREGGGVAVLHAAMLAEENWNWFRKLVGAQFKDHPKIQKGELLNVAPAHNLNMGLPKSWTHTDEWYNYVEVPQNVTVLLKVDESTYEGGIHGKDHPIAWYHDYDGGRVFYTAIGHTFECWKDPLFLKHILNGIKYSAGI